MGQVEKYRLHIELDEATELKLEKLALDSGLSKAVVVRTLINSANRIVPRTEWEAKDEMATSK